MDDDVDVWHAKRANEEDRRGPQNGTNETQGNKREMKSWQPHLRTFPDVPH